ncbi:cyclic nucleotide-binding domain-containing protein [Parasulfuritortus cantonensis]|uniref:Cyclic nucleotide-binding domain-containing protein n=1 Tax=Parasulfuritortus cantonensis TaxID=2528202 RepID=A0A4R1B5Y5_9PROT|nr:cyclic nucleotide-binding domain-containing protein [Parasulfuritortus cantonensis]TCJ11957.1 cyclic nucleotide-binding domain-containing protein [Parasulfuritortus cantonensis]
MLLKRYLSTLPGFAFMTAEDVDHIASAMTVEEYPDAHVFLYQDKPARAFHLLLEGAVKVGYYGRENRYYAIRVLKPGEFFGGLSLVDSKPVMANYSADGMVKVASMPLSAFLLLYQPNSAIGCHFQHVIATQLAWDLKARHVALRDLLGKMYPAG